ncbi:hypothetical protein ARMA_1370 [Ardenticatena maritima]|uniref:Uncharacterized protein n=1 Tax=Ardenticatena maritima TaxID=872965 RepID=A0A0M9UCK7_9CHLR|nr:hypothetical protein ARMA_1370 [Ardenticatena maritima]
MRDFYGGSIVWGMGLWCTTVGFAIAFVGWLLHMTKPHQTKESV